MAIPAAEGLRRAGANTSSSCIRACSATAGGSHEAGKRLRDGGLLSPEAARKPSACRSQYAVASPGRSGSTAGRRRGVLQPPASSRLPAKTTIRSATSRMAGTSIPSASAARHARSAARARRSSSPATGPCFPRPTRFCRHRGRTQSVGQLYTVGLGIAHDATRGFGRGP